MWYPRFIKRMRCEHEWNEPFILKYEKKYHWMFDDGFGGTHTVSVECCRKCGKWETHRWIGFPERGEKRISIEEFHQMRRNAWRKRPREIES
jgi:hypothetical protein